VDFDVSRSRSGAWMQKLFILRHGAPLHVLNLARGCSTRFAIRPVKHGLPIIAGFVQKRRIKNEAGLPPSRMMALAASSQSLFSKTHLCPRRGKKEGQKKGTCTHDVHARARAHRHTQSERARARAHAQTRVSTRTRACHEGRGRDEGAGTCFL
jgi:hypothetical protein